MLTGLLRLLCAAFRARGWDDPADEVAALIRWLEEGQDIDD